MCLYIPSGILPPHGGAHPTFREDQLNCYSPKFLEPIEGLRELSLSSVVQNVRNCWSLQSAEAELEYRWASGGTCCASVLRRAEVLLVTACSQALRNPENILAFDACCSRVGRMDQRLRSQHLSVFSGLVS